MRRLALGTAIALGGVLAARALAPKLHQSAMAGCQRMLDEAPDEFPPKRMMRGIEEIRANTARSLELLERRDIPDNDVGRLGDARAREMESGGTRAT